MNRMFSESRTLAACEKCSELLNHRIEPSESGTVVVLRVEPCPDCMGKAKEIVSALLDCPDLNLDELDEVTVDRIGQARKWLGEG